MVVTIRQHEGYEWCFRRVLLFDFLLFVFSENALAISNSFFLVAEQKETQAKIINAHLAAIMFSLVNVDHRPQCPTNELVK